MPVRQPFLTVLLQTPFTGFALEQVPEFDPPPLASQRQRYSLAVSGTAPSLAVPTRQPFRMLLLHSAGFGEEQVEECVSSLPSQRQR